MAAEERGNDLTRVDDVTLVECARCALFVASLTLPEDFHADDDRTLKMFEAYEHA